MAINNVVWNSGDLITETKLDNMVADEVNSIDDIHPQYRNIRIVNAYGGYEWETQFQNTSFRDWPGLNTSPVNNNGSSIGFLKGKYKKIKLTAFVGVFDIDTINDVTFQFIIRKVDTAGLLHAFDNVDVTGSTTKVISSSTTNWTTFSETLTFATTTETDLLYAILQFKVSNTTGGTSKINAKGFHGELELPIV